MDVTPDYKKQAAAEAYKLITKDLIIGLGAGTSISHLVDMIAADKVLADSLTFTSSSFTTNGKLQANNLHVVPPAYLEKIDIYFDGCDQFDNDLNALKCGGGIHTIEKILAAMAKQFVLIGDSDKMVERLDTKYPLVIEVLPPALMYVRKKLAEQFPGVSLSLRNCSNKDGATISEYGNYLIDVKFSTLPDLAELNTAVKMTPGVVDHSLFFGMATTAIVAGPNGIAIIKPGKAS